MSSPHRRSRPLLRSVLLSNAAVLAATLAVATATPLTPLTAQGATHPITAADISAWKTIRGATLSHDGAWFAYLVVPNEGDAEVVVKQTAAGGKELRFPVGEVPAGGGGPGAGGSVASLQLAGDGKWVAMLVYPKAAEQKRLRQQRRPVVSKALVVNLATGDKREFDRVRRVAFGGDTPQWLAMQAFGPDAPAGGGGAGGAGGPAPGAPGMGGNPLGGGGGRVEGTDMLLYELGTSALFNVGNVADFAFDNKGRWLAYAIDAREQAGNGVQLRELATGVVKSIDAGKALYRRLAWSDTLNALAFVKGTADSAATDTAWTAVGVSRVGAPTQQLVTVGEGSKATLPNGMEVSPDRAPRWLEQQDALLIGLRVATPPLPRSEQLEDDDRPTLILWHHKDPRLQSMQLVQEQADKGFSFMATYLPATQQVVQLTNAEVRTGTVGAHDRWLLSSESQPYERQASVDGIQFRDLYLTDVRTGNRVPVKQRMVGTSSLSPDGRTVLFWNDGNFHAYDVATKNVTNLTAGAPTSFIDTEDDHNVDRPSTDFIDWSRDGRFVLISDNYDVWRVGLGGKSWANLTGNGRAERIRYNRVVRTDPTDRTIDLTKPVYIVAMQARTKKESVVRIDPAKNGVVSVTGWRDARYAPIRAKNADVWVSTIQTSTRFPDYWRVSFGANALADSVRLSDANPNLNGVAWSAGSRLVNYVTEKGDSLQGALYLPAGYQEGKQYPTLTFIYELQSDNLNSFYSPTFSSSPNALIGVHTSRGYAVFLPDIVYKLNDPGMSAVWSVVPAVKAAIRTGVVDSANVGLHGHSWGGYQTSFLVTQTNIFKSAVAGAPLTDMISMYSSVYWNTGGANQGIFQSSQGRFKGNFIENREAYERNSPNRFADKVKTPLVILHDDKDGAVDFNQGITYYNTLRQLNKDVILLEYVGENHGLSQLRNRRDYSQRLMEYWDSYLKGQPAPEWLKNGIPRLKMDEHLRDQKKKLDPKKVAM
ncbi:MAG TPA: S9 family peptidase [Gemmatimonas aurantiaca]|uniref:S9 family peptidase n=2 Tax=Gemmatimonas aurantiaca TaxID=173480 RepID=A0A3D4VC01_9BACT|nr:prolyl oligopeptidase family serine peptidase [Gemmatimonas aurantiaca]BAH39841.1 putative S9C family peptidase [Gemmatimonas aurantiaca T-27]HCT58148.1 S9 family peptidase [Gemmatimonas aurantiaca]